jgi:DNA-binding MarR family transcriptional regulator
MNDGDALDLWRGVQLVHLQLTSILHRGLVDDLGLSYKDFVVLAELARGPKRVVELAHSLGLEKSRLSHQLDSLQARDLIDRRPTPGDARGASVVLTAAGRRLHRRALPNHVARVQLYFGAHISARDGEVLRSLLDRIEAALL